MFLQLKNHSANFPPPQLGDAHQKKVNEHDKEQFPFLRVIYLAQVSCNSIFPVIHAWGLFAVGRDCSG